MVSKYYQEEDEAEKDAGLQEIVNNPGETSFSGALQCEPRSRWAETWLADEVREQWR